VAIAAGHFGGDAPGKLAIAGAGKREVAAPAMAGAGAVFIHAQDIGIAFAHPDRRGGRGRAQHHADAVPRGGGDRAIEPGKIEPAFLGLHPAPGEFGDAHGVDMGLLHQGKVGVPARFGPLFGIPRGAKGDTGRRRRLHWRWRRCRDGRQGRGAGRKAEA
jgi:hypothetical protein